MTNNATKQKAIWYGPRQILLMILTGLCMFLLTCMVVGSSNTVYPGICEARGWDSSPLMLLVGIAGLLDGVLILIFSPLARKNSKALIVTGLLVSAVCEVIFASTSSLTVAVIVNFIMIFSASAFCTVGAFVITAVWWPTKKGEVLGWTTIGYVLPNIVWTSQVPKYYASIGIFNTHLILAIIMVVVALLFIFAIKNTPEAAGLTPDGMTGMDLETAKQNIQAMAEYKSPYTRARLLKSPSTWTMALATGLPLAACMAFLFTYFPANMMLGYDMETISLAMTVGGIISCVGSWLFGVIDGKIGTKKANFICCLCIIVGFVIALFNGQSVICLWVSSAIIFCANGAGRNLMPSFIGTKYGRWDYAAAYGIIGTIGYLVGCIGNFAPSIFTSGYNTMYIICIVVMALAAVFNQLTNDSFIGKAD